MASHHLTIAAAVRAHPDESVSGDAWRVDWNEDCCRIAVIDGLGHGVEAAAAAAAALTALAGHPDLTPPAALERCHQAMRGTRGAAVGIAAIDLAARRVSFAGVGNVEARVWQSDSEKRLSSARGIVGVLLPRLRSEDVELAEGWRLALHSDGVSARFNLHELISLERNLQSVADAILSGWGRAADDATVVLAGVEVATGETLAGDT
jgi:serine phosphatase RsbU (regulator of sigma subunit)